MAVALEAGSFERAHRDHRRPRYSLEPTAVTWDAVVFRLHGERAAYACVPRRSLAAFFAELDSGALDATIEAFLASAPSGRILRAADGSSTPGLFDELASPDAIVPPERRPGRPAPFGRGGGTPTGDRPDKRARQPRPRRLAIAGAAVAVAAVVVVGAIALASGGDDSSTVTVGAPASTTTTTTSTTTATTAPTVTDLTAIVGEYRVTQVYAGCGSIDSTIADAPLPVTADFATGIITVGVAKAVGPLEGTSFRAPIEYQGTNGQKLPGVLVGSFDLTGPSPRIHIESHPDYTGTGSCTVTYDGFRA